MWCHLRNVGLLRAIPTWPADFYKQRTNLQLSNFQQTTLPLKIARHMTLYNRERRHILPFLLCQRHLVFTLLLHFLLPGDLNTRTYLYIL